MRGGEEKRRERDEGNTPLSHAACIQACMNGSWGTNAAGGNIAFANVGTVRSADASICNDR